MNISTAGTRMGAGSIYSSLCMNLQPWICSFRRKRKKKSWLVVLIKVHYYKVETFPENFRLNIPSIDKGKHAWQRVFPALFALFALAGVSPPASQKPKITRKSIVVRCEAVLPVRKCVHTRKDPQRILGALSRGLTLYGRISARKNRVCPCKSMVWIPH